MNKILSYYFEILMRENEIFILKLYNTLRLNYLKDLLLRGSALNITFCFAFIYLYINAAISNVFYAFIIEKCSKNMKLNPPPKRTKH